jgi:hypothetical protein
MQEVPNEAFYQMKVTAKNSSVAFNMIQVKKNGTFLLNSEKIHVGTKK